MRYRYTEKELEELFSSIVFLVDTREQKNQHILKWLDEYRHKDKSVGIKYRKKKLESGDYSFFLPKNIEHGIFKDVYFDDLLIIERKKDLDELSGNLTAYRERFKNEFSRSTAKKFHLIIENGNYLDITNHRYISAMSPRSYLASLLSFREKYNIHIDFVDKKYSAEHMYFITRQFFMNYMTSKG